MIMRILPRLLAIAWAILVLGSLFLTYMMPVAEDPVARAWSRIEVFLTWQGTALAVALAAAFFSWRRADKRGGEDWWMGWGPLVGTGFIAIVALSAVVMSRFV